MADPLSQALFGIASAGFLAYQRMQPTTESVKPDPKSDIPSEQYATLKNKRWIIRRGGATTFEGMETSSKRMLEGERPADEAPELYLDNPEFIAWIRRESPRNKTIKAHAYDAEFVQALYLEWLRKKAAAVGKTLDVNLAAELAENIRSQNEMLSGKTGHIYNMENELKPIIYRKNTNKGRFSPYKNAIDDSTFMVPQRGMTFAFPPVTRMGVSKHYNLKANSDSGGYYDPSRAAPSRVDKPSNVYSPPEGAGIKGRGLRVGTRQFLGSMM